MGELLSCGACQSVFCLREGLGREEGSASFDGRTRSPGLWLDEVESGLALWAVAIVLGLSHCLWLAQKRSQPIGLITLDVKSTGKPSAGKRHAGFDVAGTGTVIMGVGLRPIPKGVEEPPNPTVGAPVLDPTCEGLGYNGCMAEIVWHHRETRWQLRKQTSTCSIGSPQSTRQKLIQPCGI